MNVLIYNGEGTSVSSVRQTKAFLTGLLQPYYAVSLISAEQLIEEPWMPHTALLIIPGGADLPYCKALNGKGNARIKQFVRKGGKFWGICAGGYYAARRIEFEKGTSMEVSGPRELGFYDGDARGTVFKGFVYGSDVGARASKVFYTKDGTEHATATYYNGGCLFEGDPDAEVIARYAGPIEMDASEDHPAAIVFKKYEEGSVLLSGVHFEYDLDEKAHYKGDIPREVINRIYEARQSRLKLVEYMFAEKLNLKISVDGKALPKITPLHFSSLPQHKPSVDQVLQNLKPQISADDGLLHDRDNSFRFVSSENLQISEPEKDDNLLTVIYYGGDTYPTQQRTPFFNHQTYYNELESQKELLGVNVRPTLGSALLYGEVVTSTSSILERNPVFLRNAPHGLAFYGMQQIAGRGRGSNVWVNPIGVMAVSGIIRIPQSQCRQSLVFIQYLTAIAVVRATHSFLAPGTDIGLRLKWPNDIYIKIDDHDHEHSLVKVGGIMVNCNAFNGDYVIVFGSGTNVDNPHPTTSINSRIGQLGAGSQIQIEQLLARFLTILDDMVQRFFVSGFGQFEQEYRSYWLHTDAQVLLERYGNVRTVVKRVSPDTGMLIAEDSSGVEYELQPDGNSFDMFRGLIRRKT